MCDADRAFSPPSVGARDGILVAKSQLLVGEGDMLSPIREIQRGWSVTEKIKPGIVTEKCMTMTTGPGRLEDRMSSLAKLFTRPVRRPPS